MIAAFDGVYQIDLGARRAADIGFTGRYGGQLVAIEGLGYAPDGSLYGVSDNLKALFRIDALTGAARLVGPLGLSGEGQFSNLDPAFAITADGRAWLVAAVVNKLWSVDLKTGVATEVGDLGAKLTGLAARGSELFGAGSRGDEGLYRVNTQTGAASLIAGFKQTIPYSPSISIAFDSQDQLWAVINYNPPLASGELRDWSDLARVDAATGAIALQGSLDGPDSLRQIPIRGLAIAPPRIVAAASTTPVPALGPVSIGVLMFGLLGLGFGRQRRRSY